MHTVVTGRTAITCRRTLRRAVLLLGVLLAGCGSQSAPAAPTDVINTWAMAAAAGDWSRARELMTVGERRFTAWRVRQETINPGLNPPHQVLNVVKAGATTSATVRWPAKTGGWCAAVYIDKDAKLTVVHPDPLYACAAQGQAMHAPAEGETAPRRVVTAADVFPNAIELDPIGKVQPGDGVVVMSESYYGNTFWYKVRPAPGSAANWTEGYIVAAALGDTR